MVWWLEFRRVFCRSWRSGATPHEGKSARSRRVGKERGVCGVARLVHSIHYGPRRAPCIRSLSLPTRLTGNTQTGSGSLALLQSEDAWSMFLGEFEDPAAAACDAGQRIVRHHHWQPGLFHEQFINVPQQRAAAREHDAALGHIGSEFRRSLFEGLLDGAHDALQGFLQGLENFVGVQGEASRYALGEVAALDRNLANLLAVIR